VPRANGTPPARRERYRYTRRSKRNKRRRRGKRRNCYQRWLAKTGGTFAPININTATAKQLRTLPCIGKKRALGIIAQRKGNGPFRTRQGLKKVSGIGNKTYGWIRPHIRIKLNVNTATLAEFEALRPLSGGLGEAILKYRKRRGPFRSLRHLLRVRGMGRGTLSRLRPFLVVTPPPKALPKPTVIKIQ
jgi:competence protein ComEA